MSPMAEHGADGIAARSQLPYRVLNVRFGKDSHREAVYV